MRNHDWSSASKLSKVLPFEIAFALEHEKLFSSVSSRILTATKLSPFSSFNLLQNVGNSLLLGRGAV